MNGNRYLDMRAYTRTLLAHRQHRNWAVKACIFQLNWKPL